MRITNEVEGVKLST